MTTESGSPPGKRRALGQGINALLGGRPPAPSPAATHPGIRKIAVDHILPNPLQPRRSFPPDRLNELAASIRTHGLVQPLLVRPAADGKFEIVAGERRWRAARLAGLDAVPALVQEISQERLLEVALVENIQREDLNPIELARAFEQLTRDFGLTHDQIAQRTGKDRATITNALRLLKLTHTVQTLIAEGQLGMGHARALVGLNDTDQRELAERIVAQGLSVRWAERLAIRVKEPPLPGPTQPQDPNVRAALQEMERALGTRVRIVERGKGRGGRLEIDYYSPEDLERIYNRIVPGEK